MGGQNLCWDLSNCVLCLQQLAWEARQRVCKQCGVKQPGTSFRIYTHGAFMGQSNACRNCMRVQQQQIHAAEQQQMHAAAADRETIQPCEIPARVRMFLESVREAPQPKCQGAIRPALPVAVFGRQMSPITKTFMLAAELPVGDQASAPAGLHVATLFEVQLLPCGHNLVADYLPAIGS